MLLHPLVPILSLLLATSRSIVQALSIPPRTPFGPQASINRGLSGRNPQDTFAALSARDLISGPPYPSYANDTQTLTHLVTWDNYTLSVMGQRVFMMSGEFHPWRLPSGPELWRDIVQKAKSAGFNTISIYLHWGLSNPSNGTLDFDYFRSVQPIIDLCMESGMFMVMRPGPYINAETTAGGIPGWVVALEGELRTDAPDYTESWQEYMNYVSEITAKNQISNGGPIIAVQVENEYYSNSSGTYDLKRTNYVAQLEENLRAHGVNVPTMHNDASPRANYHKGPGAVDIYAFDQYPQGFDCANPNVWSPLPTTWHESHISINPEQPAWIAEFQGGAFDPWGSKVGYPACFQLTGPDFERVFYKGLWAANVKLLNLYMLYGGTSWGQLAFPGVYTSYDYGSPIAENRLLTSKFDELKLQAMFLRSARDFLKTDWVADSLTDPLRSDLFFTELHNPDTGSHFYFIRHDNSSSYEDTSFVLNVAVTLLEGQNQQQISIPIFSGQTSVNGRDHRLIVTDYNIGANSTLAYCTASIMYSGSIGDMDVLVVYADEGLSEGLEFAVRGNASQPVVDGDLDVEWTYATEGHTTFNFTTTTSGLSSIQLDNLLILVADTRTATTFWSPTLAVSSSSSSVNSDPFQNFYSFGTNKTALVSGPYLVRNATLTSGVLSLTGDLNTTSTNLLVYAGDECESVLWNGEPVEVTKTSWGGWKGVLTAGQAFDQYINLPALDNWVWKDSLPEVKYGYDDSHWTVADHTTTTNPFPPFANNSGPQILYGNDYDYHAGNLLWRGEFNGESQTGIELGISGGWAFAASVWLNEKAIGYMYSRNGSSNPTINSTFSFPEGVLQEGTTNWLTVLQDHMGYSESYNTNTPGGGQLDIKSPRGIQGFSLLPRSASSNFTSWKVQGNLGGSSNFPDRVRGVYNEGGLYGERAGWHLPGFDDSDWETRSPTEGLPEPGVGFFRTTFDLSIPDDLDVPINVLIGPDTFNDDSGAVRAQLYINGWSFGKYVKQVGPQHIFPIPRGIIQTSGTNTIALSLWGMDDKALDLSLESISLSHDELVKGGVGYVSSYNPGWVASERPGY